MNTNVLFLGRKTSERETILKKNLETRLAQSVSWLYYRLEGRPEFDFRLSKLFSLSHNVLTGSWANPVSVQWVPGFLSGGGGVKRRELEASHERPHRDCRS
jgi:hypothetical protein